MHAHAHASSAASLKVELPVNPFAVCACTLPLPTNKHKIDQHAVLCHPERASGPAVRLAGRIVGLSACLQLPKHTGD